jgi:hypothetical protein
MEEELQTVFKLHGLVITTSVMEELDTPTLTTGLFLLEATRLAFLTTSALASSE